MSSIILFVITILLNSVDSSAWIPLSPTTITTHNSPAPTLSKSDVQIGTTKVEGSITAPDRRFINYNYNHNRLMSMIECERTNCNKAQTALVEGSKSNNGHVIVEKYFVSSSSNFDYKLIVLCVISVLLTIIVVVLFYRNAVNNNNSSRTIYKKPLQKLRTERLDFFTV